MLFFKTSRDPLVDSHSNHLSKSNYTRFFIFKLLGFVDSFEEECCERFERVLVHIIDDAKLNE